jgi:hypothetical protein
VPDVNNPRGVQFTASADHAQIDSYELSIFRPTGTLLQVLNVGKPTPDANNICTVQLNVQPISFGVGYTVQMTARAGTAVSDPVDAVNKFNRVPGGSSNVVIIK